MGGECGMHGRGKMNAELWLENLKERGGLED